MESTNQVGESPDLGALLRRVFEGDPSRHWQRDTEGKVRETPEGVSDELLRMHTDGEVEIGLSPLVGPERCKLVEWSGQKAEDRQALDEWLISQGLVPDVERSPDGWRIFLFAPAGTDASVAMVRRFDAWLRAEGVIGDGVSIWPGRDAADQPVWLPLGPGSDLLDGSGEPMEDSEVVELLESADDLSDEALDKIIEKHGIPGLPQDLEASEVPQMVAQVDTEAVSQGHDSLQSVRAVLGKWLYMEDGEQLVVDVVLGTVVANRFPGDPVWILVVGPAGAVKTEILRTLSGLKKEIYVVSSLTRNALISGLATKGKDPSLLPKLHGKVLVVKDFTAVLSLPADQRLQILGDLRDAYDGEAAKAFGSGVGTRSYKSKFGFIGAVTPKIDAHHTVSQQLGERFLKFRVSARDRLERARKAISNSGKETQMREELTEAVHEVLRACDVREEESIALSDEQSERLLNLADLTALLRSEVDRDGYGRGIRYEPEPEVGTRLAKQLTKLARGIAAIRGKREVTEEEFGVVRRIAQDSLTKKRLAAVSVLYRSYEEGHLATKEVGEEMRMPTSTVNELLEDLWLLKVVERQGKSPYTWRMVGNIRGQLKRIGFFGRDITGVRTGAEETVCTPLISLPKLPSQRE